MKNTENKIYENNINFSAISLIDKNNSEILDIGCGTGVNACHLVSKGNIVDGVTLSTSEKEIAQVHMRDVYLFNLENGLPNIENKYDYVFCSHVIEHIAYPNKLLNDIHKILKENGKLIIAVPNIMLYKSRLQLLLGNFPEEESGIWDFTHLRWYTSSKMRNLLKSNNFNILIEKFDGDLPLGSITKYFPEKFKKSLIKILINFSPGLFSKQFIYAAKKN